MAERTNQELEVRIKAVEDRIHALSNSLQVELLSIRKELGERIENFAKDWLSIGNSLQDEGVNLRMEIQELVMSIDARIDRLSQIVHERTDSLVVYGAKSRCSGGEVSLNGVPIGSMTGVKLSVQK